MESRHLPLLLVLACSILLGHFWMARDEHNAAHAGYQPPLTTENMNKQLLAARYAVRGELLIKADQLKEKIAKNKSHGLPFDEVVFCNIGNPQALKQPPITFFRQVLSLCMYPDLLSNTAVVQAFAPDAVARAKKYLASIPGGTGAYSHSQGVPVVREEVAEFIKERDGHPADPQNIFLTDGASAGVKMLLGALIRGHNDGVMVPVPQYPLYSASLTLFGGVRVGYYLNESKGWDVDATELERAYAEARKEGTIVRALVVINPGNPTGQSLPASTMQDIIRFCVRHNLLLMADEVYQTNIYGSIPFNSFKKVLMELATAEPQNGGMQLVSFHSASKGFVGECGARGGYFELHNIPKAVHDELYKFAAISLCSNLVGQLMIGLMVRPPRDGDASYALYTQERDAILQSLKYRAKLVAGALNNMTNIQCNDVDGAMYAFPQIKLPKAAVKAAEDAKQAPDEFYCHKLLDATGICVVPGSGFGQASGTYHFRTTILPPTEVFESLLARMKKFNNDFMSKYKD